VREEIATAWVEIERAVREAEARAHRPQGSVSILAVTKRQPFQRVQEFCSIQREHGRPLLLGENYVQEFEGKREELMAAAVGASLEVHMVGPLQRNKVRRALQLFDCIQSVHSLPLLDEIAKEATRSGRVASVFLQVNVSEEPQKSGFLPREVVSVLQHAEQHQAVVALKGLMAIPKYFEDPEGARPEFRKLNVLRSSLLDSDAGQRLLSGGCLLSMGMSGDFPVAIEEGADLIRIGSRLFGERVSS
jgi:pyridoxal phosphate enzyme (YggS family)